MKRNSVSKTNMGEIYGTYAHNVIMAKINSKINGSTVNGYGEYLYGDHVDSPSYDDYLESNCGDNE